MGRRSVALFILALIILGMHSSCSLPPEGSPDWYYNRAYDLAEQGLYEEAVEEYTKVLENNPTNTIRIQTYVKRAAAYNSLQLWEESISDSTEAINLDPENKLAYLNRAVAYGYSGKYDLAIVDFGKAIELDDTIAEAYVNRAYAYYKKGGFQKAIEDCNQALEIDPGQSYAYFNRGLVYKELGHVEEAISDFENFISMTTSPTWIERATRELDSLLDEESDTEEPES